MMLFRKKLYSLVTMLLLLSFVSYEGCSTTPTVKEKTSNDGGPNDTLVQKDTGETNTPDKTTERPPESTSKELTPDPAKPDTAEPTPADKASEPHSEPGKEISTPDTRPDTVVDSPPARTCDDVKTEYAGLVKSAETCENANDCHVINGHCSVGLGGCWYTTHNKLTQAKLDALSKEWGALKCKGGGVCDCSSAPSAAQCVEGKCKPATKLTCKDITNQYNALLQANKGCSKDADCHILTGHCGQGLGGCHYTTNKSLTQAQLDALLTQWKALQCTGPVCRCTAPPTATQCTANVCAVK